MYSISSYKMQEEKEDLFECVKCSQSPGFQNGMFWLISEIQHQNCVDIFLKHDIKYSYVRILEYSYEPYKPLFFTCGNADNLGPWQKNLLLQWITPISFHALSLCSFKLHLFYWAATMWPINKIFVVSRWSSAPHSLWTRRTQLKYTCPVICLPPQNPSFSTPSTATDIIWLWSTSVPGTSGYCSGNCCTWWLIRDFFSPSVSSIMTCSSLWTYSQSEMVCLWNKHSSSRPGKTGTYTGCHQQMDFLAGTVSSISVPVSLRVRV